MPSTKHPVDPSRLILMTAEGEGRVAQALLSTSLMDQLLKRFDVFLAVITVGAVSVFGDASVRWVDVSGLLALWAAYFSASAGMRFFRERTLRPALAE